MQRNMIFCFECFCCQSAKRVFNTVRPFVFPCTWIDVFVGASYFYCRFWSKGIAWARHGFWDLNIEFWFVLMTTCLRARMVDSRILAQLFAQMVGILNMNTTNMNKGIFGNSLLNNVWIIMLWCWRNGSYQNWFLTSQISSLALN